MPYKATTAAAAVAAEEGASSHSRQLHCCLYRASSTPYFIAIFSDLNKTIHKVDWLTLVETGSISVEDREEGTGRRRDKEEEGEKGRKRDGEGGTGRERDGERVGQGEAIYSD